MYLVAAFGTVLPYDEPYAWDARGEVQADFVRIRAL